MLITFEGIDGAGKSTLAQMTFDFLRQKGVEVTLYREPGGTEIGERLREMLFSEVKDSILELLLFEASRRSLVIQRIKPDLVSKKVVIVDRFTDSTLAYQGYGRGIDLTLIMHLNDLATEGVRPDLTFLIDIDPTTSLKRIGKLNRFEDVNFLTKVRKGFLELASREPERFFLINGDKPLKEAFEEVVKKLKMILIIN
jgi:dTMP kinase